MSNPVEHLINSRDLVSNRLGRAINHNDGKVQRPSRGNLGIGPCPAGILRHDKRDGMVPHQLSVTIGAEGAARYDHVVVRERRRAAWWVNEPQNIAMLGVAGEFRQGLATNRQQHRFTRTIESLGGGFDVSDAGPTITSHGRPGRARERNDGNARVATGGDGVTAHLRGKRMGRIDDMGHFLIAQVGHQTVPAAKTPDPLRHGLSDRTRYPAGKGHDAVIPKIRQRPRQGGRLGGSAENQKVWFHV